MIQTNHLLLASFLMSMLTGRTTMAQKQFELLKYKLNKIVNIDDHSSELMLQPFVAWLKVKNYLKWDDAKEYCQNLYDHEFLDDHVEELQWVGWREYARVKPLHPKALIGQLLWVREDANEQRVAVFFQSNKRRIKIPQGESVLRQSLCRVMYTGDVLQSSLVKL